MINFRWVLLTLFLVLSTICYAENLYNVDSYHALTSDRRAYQVGDILTVVVLENSSASATAGTKTDKSNDAAVKFLSPTSQKNYSLGLNEDFNGNGKIARSGKLLAQLSVTVGEIANNGDLFVKGEQLIEINGEKQSINLQGRVRSRDIDENNIILSSKIADAKITYIGDGVLADSQHKGWLSRVISILGLI